MLAVLPPRLAIASCGARSAMVAMIGRTGPLGIIILSLPKAARVENLRASVNCTWRESL
jgi:hypothetical protein